MCTLRYTDVELGTNCQHLLKHLHLASPASTGGGRLVSSAGGSIAFDHQSWPGANTPRGCVDHEDPYRTNSWSSSLRREAMGDGDDVL